MNVAYYARRLFQVPPSYVLGRFYTVRALFSRWMQLRQRLNSSLFPLQKALPSEIIHTDTRTAISALRQEALAEGIILPAALVTEIKAFAQRVECKVTGVKETFRYTDVVKGRLPDGTFVALGHCQNSIECAAICAIRDDPLLNAIVTGYLGYLPRSRDVWLYWSFAGDASDDERRQLYQTIDYHYDVHDFNFCYVHIYLTPTDSRSGAHVMVKGSHRRKPLRWLFGPARQTDQLIEKYYGKGKVRILEGAAGMGFIEDTSCYHKALAPIDRDRLLLQIRYH